nr:putative RNA-directed DNA polymerase [Tanacetum cinerariifolium]
FGDLQWGNILITRVYFVEGFGHNLFSVGQFCDSDLEVAFRRNACFVRNIEGVDLLKGDRSTNLYTINLHEMASASPICLMDRASSTKKLDISFLHVFEALCYPKNDREDIEKLGAKGDIGFFIGYSADSCAYRIYNRRTKKIMETMNVSFDELSAMAFEQRSSKPKLQTMYDDYIGDQPSATARTVLAVQEPQVRQTSTASTSIADTTPTLTNSSSFATNSPNTSQDVDELNLQQQHVQQQGTQAHLQSKTVAENVPNALFDGNTFVNPFANPSTSAAESSSLHNVDPSNMHTFYQPYPYEFQ